jgi:hypothetical protein
MNTEFLERQLERSLKMAWDMEQNSNELDLRISILYQRKSQVDSQRQALDRQILELREEIKKATVSAVAQNTPLTRADYSRNEDC